VWQCYLSTLLVRLPAERFSVQVSFVDDVIHVFIAKRPQADDVADASGKSPDEKAQPQPRVCLHLLIDPLHPNPASASALPPPSAASTATDTAFEAYLCRREAVDEVLEARGPTATAATTLAPAPSDASQAVTEGDVEMPALQLPASTLPLPTPAPHRQPPAASPSASFTMATPSSLPGPPHTPLVCPAPASSAAASVFASPVIVRYTGNQHPNTAVLVHRQLAMPVAEDHYKTGPDDATVVDGGSVSASASADGLESRDSVAPAGHPLSRQDTVLREHALARREADELVEEVLKCTHQFLWEYNL
jgi:hypothetical protein